MYDASNLADLHSNWEESDDRTSIGLKLSTGDFYYIDKRILVAESKYFFSCLIDARTPSLQTATKLSSMQSHQLFAYDFIIQWLSDSPTISSSGSLSLPKHEISLPDWCEKYEWVTFRAWSEIYCMAHLLKCATLLTHVSSAVSLKAQRTWILPTMKAVNFLYEFGPADCALKNQIVDIYAIARLRSNVFRGEEGQFPGSFVDAVHNYGQTAAWVRRRLAYVRCKRGEEEDDEVEEMEEMGVEDGPPKPPTNGYSS